MLRVISPIALSDELSARRRGTGKIDRSATIDGIQARYPRYWNPPHFLRGMATGSYRHCLTAPVRQLNANWQPDVVVSHRATLMAKPPTRSPGN